MPAQEVRCGKFEQLEQGCSSWGTMLKKDVYPLSIKGGSS
jgi:hypothetical protein